MESGFWTDDGLLIEEVNIQVLEMVLQNIILLMVNKVLRFILSRSTMNGEWVNWFQDGSKKEFGNYIDGGKTGPWKGWYENGQKKYVMHYQNNLSTVYILNGQKTVN